MRVHKTIQKQQNNADRNRRIRHIENIKRPASAMDMDEIGHRAINHAIPDIANRPPHE